MKRIGKCLFIVITCITGALVFTSCATVDGSGGVVVRDRDTRVEVAFSTHDRDLIRKHYKKHHKKHHKKMPPGLAKKEELPPGLKNRIKKKGQLPPGLQRNPLPPELEANLSPLPRGYIRVRVGADILLLDERTQIVMDVIYDAAF